MEASGIINYLRDEKILEFWQARAKSDSEDENEETVTAELFNHFLEENDSRDFTTHPLAYDIFMHGLHCIDWSYVYELLKKETEDED